MSFTTKNKSTKKTLSNSCPSVEPCGTPNIRSSKLLQVFSIFVLSFRFHKWSLMSRNADKLKPYAYGFAVNNSWLSQSNAIEKFVSKAAKTVSLSTDLFHVSVVTRRQYWFLKWAKWT